MPERSSTLGREAAHEPGPTAGAGRRAFNHRRGELGGCPGEGAGCPRRPSHLRARALGTHASTCGPGRARVHGPASVAALWLTRGSPRSAKIRPWAARPRSRLAQSSGLDAEIRDWVDAPVTVADEGRGSLGERRTHARRGSRLAKPTSGRGRRGARFAPSTIRPWSSTVETRSGYERDVADEGQRSLGGGLGPGRRGSELAKSTNGAWSTRVEGRSAELGTLVVELSSGSAAARAT